ncbi:MAG: hypothetical protein H0W88_04700 [Parachlamydiaceae bacterium]|nr:hypothetical protein [Parachlamydiaceae bacterium]
MSNPSNVRVLRYNRVAYWHESTGSVIIRNPKAVGGGTVFKPKNGINYFLEELF